MTQASKIAVTMLDVGQGSGTFVEIYQGTVLVATALLDLGSERAKSEAGGPSVAYIEKMLKSMTTPRIDFLSLSHSDSDHINLIQDLLSRFDKPKTKKPKKPILEVGTIVYGGPRVRYAKHSGNNVIKQLETYQPKGTKKPDPLPANNCSYSQTTPVFSLHEVEFYLLVGNHIAGMPRTVRTKIGDKQWKTDSYSLNTYSLIFVVVFDDWMYVVTGDATGATIAQANYYIKRYKAQFKNVAAMTMPHHSSEATTFGLTASKKRARPGQKRVSDDAKEVIETFAGHIKPLTIHASAEEVGSFGHPSAYTMSYFWDHVDKVAWYDDPKLAAGQHLYNAYFTEEDDYKIVLEVVDPVTKKIKKKKEALPPFADWWTFATPYSIYTNRYYVRDKAYDPKDDETAIFPPGPAKVTAIPASGAKNSPPFAVAWRYVSDVATQRTTLERVQNRKTGSSAFVATPVTRMSKSAAALRAAPADDAAAPSRGPAPRRSMAPRLPAQRAVSPSTEATAATVGAVRLPRLRLLDA